MAYLKCEQREFKQSEVHAFLVIYQRCALRGGPQLGATSGRSYALHVGFDFGGSILKDTGHSLAVGEKRLKQRCI